MDSRRSLKELVTDHERSDRANASLRASLQGKSICIWTQRQIITAAAAMDGGVVLDRNGRILDVACMFGEPPEISKQGLSPSGLTGARSLAAWRASFKGLAIKVSEDGPVTVFENGKIIGHMGGGHLSGL
jgi:DNA integrity scanning protein DisA with diadenylate cyclase activity